MFNMMCKNRTSLKTFSKFSNPLFESSINIEGNVDLRFDLLAYKLKFNNALLTRLTC